MEVTYGREHEPGRAQDQPQTTLRLLGAAGGSLLVGGTIVQLDRMQASNQNADAVDDPATGTVQAAMTSAEGADVVRPAGWTDATHGKTADPDRAVVFPQNKVNQITITLTPEQWAAMQANMTELLGEPGSRQRGIGQPREIPPQDDAAAQGAAPAERAVPQQGGPPEGGGDMTAENPMWVAGMISFEGQTWTNVGVRYKGNSSLSGSWGNGSGKLPFKLDFDQFEDEYPEIANQRFYGFKQLSLSNNWNDASYMREGVVYDLLDQAGLVAAETAFYEVRVDHGEGAQSLGLYTMIEVIDDTVVQRFFDGDSGNVYEGDGQAASLAQGTEGQIEASFQKENNEVEADWSDIQKLYEVLHSEERTTDPAAWRANLEAIFDVDVFLKWLGIAAVLQHWDTYGAMTHNYYLYNNPETGKLTWISWDHNEVLAASSTGGGGGNGGRGGRSTSLDKADVGENWPLIRYLLDDELTTPGTSTS